MGTEGEPDSDPPDGFIVMKWIVEEDPLGTRRRRAEGVVSELDLDGHIIHRPHTLILRGVRLWVAVQAAGLAHEGCGGGCSRRTYGSPSPLRSTSLTLTPEYISAPLSRKGIRPPEPRASCKPEIPQPAFVNSLGPFSHLQARGDRRYFNVARTTTDRALSVGRRTFRANSAQGWLA